MTGVAAVWNLLRRAAARDLGTFGSIKVNNLFLFAALLAYGALNSGVKPRSAEPFFLLLGFLLLFPLSSDPLGRIPASRMGLWPLSSQQRLGLRFLSLILSPVVWLGLLMVAATARPLAALAVCGLAAGIQTIAVLRRRAAVHNRHWSVLRLAPDFPGRWGGLVRKNLREMLSLLDPYAALLLSAGGAAYRILAKHPEPEAFAILALLVALTLSTSAQSLFGLELGPATASGMTRYRILPLAGWHVLLTKDIAYLTMLLVLLLPLDAGAGMTFGLVSLALGHHSSVLLDIPQHRWRFARGRLLPVGAAQAIGGMALGFLEYQHGWTVLLGAAAMYGLSLAYYGRRLERRPL